MPILPKPARRGLPIIVFLTAACVVLVIVGAGLLWNVSTKRSLAADAPGFSVVSGTMRSIGFERIRRGRGSGGVRHRPQVEYAYEVEGRSLRGRVASALAPEFMTQDEAAAWFESSNVRVGGPVDVFYDPANPSRCVLLTDVPPEFASRMAEWEVGGWVCLGLSGVLAAAMVVVIVLGRRPTPRLSL